MDASMQYGTAIVIWAIHVFMFLGLVGFSLGWY
jgi:hypothetical protein